MRAVANAGPLIHLSWIDRLDLLRDLFEEVIVPPAVQEEVLEANPDTPGVRALQAAFAAGQFRVQRLTEPTAQTIANVGLGRGEVEAIALMVATEADVLLLDDRRARATARRLGLPFTGTIGILRRAQARDFISAAAPILEELQRRGFWISDGLLDEVRRDEGD